MISQSREKKKNEVKSDLDKNVGPFLGHCVFVDISQIGRLVLKQINIQGVSV